MSLTRARACLLRPFMLPTFGQTRHVACMTWHLLPLKAFFQLFPPVAWLADEAM